MYDGRTGVRRFAWDEHASGTLIETPSVVDIDRDGSAEILVASNDNNGADVWTGITALEHDGAGWAQGASSWPANARVSGRFTDNGEVESVGTWWETENTYRGLPPSEGVAIPDARVGIVDVCVASCAAGGTAEVSIQVSNPGPLTLDAGTPLDVYSVSGGVLTLVVSSSTLEQIPPGESAASTTIVVPVEALAGEGIVVVVGDPTADCHPDDNEASWADTPCP